MKNHTSKEKNRFTWRRFVNAVTNPMIVFVVVTLCFLTAIRTSPDNVRNALLVVLFAFAMMTYSKAKAPPPKSDVASHEEKTNLSIGGDSGISMNHEEKTTQQDNK